DEGETVETSIGLLPKVEELDLDGVDVTPEQMAELLAVDDAAVVEQLPQVEEHLAKFGDSLPAEIRNQFEALKGRLGA
ncbi:MAG: phosphoenolpyruvate carboxykinase (GTP), partial [Solirubrobacterales bacterium]|nr:phosphoenolpyruvate carboxykinase (GTP) [Solirubrobacterales bacterium]